MRIVPIFVSGLVGAACSIAFSYGVALLPCGLASKGADTVCYVRSFSKALDSCKFGFFAGIIVGLLCLTVVDLYRVFSLLTCQLLLYLFWRYIYLVFRIM